MKTLLALIATAIASAGYFWLYDNDLNAFRVITVAIIIGTITVLAITELGAKK
jgi:hypothetical protein